MMKRHVGILVAGLAALAFAADAPAPAAESAAPAAVVAPEAVVAKPAEKAAAPAAAVTWYGSAQYRLRLQAFMMSYDTRGDSTASDYTNQLGYFIGAKVKVGDQFNMQFQLGDDATTTEGVSFTDLAGGQGSASPFFHLALAKYDFGCANVSAGIVPLISYGALELYERSMRFNSYQNASQVSWAVGTNNGRPGLSVAAPICKDGLKLSVELFSSVAKQRVTSYSASNANDINSPFFVLNVPMSISALTFTPQVYAQLFKVYNKTLSKGDHEIGAGFLASYKINDMVSANAVFAFAQNGNEESRGTAAKYNNQGILGGVGSTIKAGPGSLAVDFKLNTDNNTEATDSTQTYIFGDVKYTMDISKNFQFMPRVRIFDTQYATRNTTASARLEVRPELIVIGKF